MSDDTIIDPVPTPVPEETPLETNEVASAPVETPEVASETPLEETTETVSESSDSGDIVAEAIAAVGDDATPPMAGQAPARVAPSRSFGPPAPARGGGGRGGRDDRGGSRGGGSRDGGRPSGGGDRRGGKSGFEQVKKEFEEVLLEVGRVTKVTSGGRQLRFRAAVVIGDRKGRVGFGLGKAQEVSIAVEKAVNSAKRHMIKVPLENGTVPYQVATKFKSVKIMIHPAAQGTGIIAGGSARRILELAGCQNILSKRHGGRNVITTAYATMEALKMYLTKGGESTFNTKDKIQNTKMKEEVPEIIEQS